MPSILIVDKSGNIKEQNIKEQTVKELVEADLYKKAGFKTADDFKCQATWNLEIDDVKYSVSLFGKTKGIAKQENKYEFPPPVDTVLFFGSCVLINTGHESLTTATWNMVYDELYGGFEDIEDTEDESVNSCDLTCSGYEKDGFVVDDTESEEEYIPKPKKTKKTKVVQEQESYLDCTSELDEEPYV